MSYIIHEISSDSSGINPTFTVFKKEISDGIILDTIPVVDTGNLLSPVIEGDGLFHTAENMQNAYCWNQGQPMPFKIKIDDERNDFVIHRELIYKINDKGEMEEHLEKTRGFWKPATIEEVEEVIDVIEHEQENGEIEYEEVEGFNGLYKIIFNDFKLTQHSQYSTTENSAEWFNGAVRLFTEDSFNSSGKPIKSRKQLKVVRTENIGSNQNLIIYCEDPDYNILDPDFNEAEYDKIKTGNNLRVNYYPGYKVYLYANQPYNLDSNGISPDEGEGIKYSVFGLRSVDNVHQINNENYKSRISTPALMFVMENIEAQTPEQPKGALYATRPDYFGRSTYTFTTKYSHKPHGLLICRSNDELLLNSLYKPETINLVRAELESRGGQEEIYFTNRWQNFLNFGLLKTEGNYAAYPPEEIEDEPLPYRFPLPDNKKFYDEINQYIKWHNTKYGTSIALIPEASVGNILLDVTLIPNLFNQTGNDKKLIDFVEEAVYYSFVPLTEMPVIYQYVFGNDYQPKDEKQVIKDKDGYPLPPNDGNFKMAPMMKILSSLPHKTLFTDFHLDGYSRNFYFYGVREVSSRMKLGEFSKFLGPVKLVNSNPPEAPEIKRIMPVLENPVLGILPHIQLEINAYPKIQNIRKVSVYRTFDRLKAQSVQFMDLVETIDLEDEELLEEDIWTVYDYFGDLPEIRYGDGIYYRLTVSRKIEYAKADYAYDDEENEEPEIVIEYAPSQASKITASLISEVKIPDAPVLEFTSGILDPETLDNVVLKWSKQVYNGKYYLYKMNRQGNWVKIKFIQTNEPEIEVALEDTDLESGQLVIKDNEGNPVYHHFKVVVENTAGMQSTEENILTIGNI